MDAYEAAGSSEDPEVRQAFSDSILHILRPLSELELPGIDSRCENNSDSSRSALSEPFSDLDDSYILLDQRKKKPGKDEGDDMMLLNQFTSEFREVYDQLIGELHEREEPLLPSDAAQEQDFAHELSLEDTSSGFSPSFQSFIDEMLLKCDLKYHLDEKKKRHDQHRRKHRRVRKVQPTVPKDALEPAERDSLSGVWRMLDAVSEPNGFPITEGQYDLYEDERFEWLLREKLPWQRMEVSRKKCEQWLKMGPGNAKTPDEKRSRQSHRPSSHRRM
ncbi:uncharacterized protein LOC118503175 [Anopheles stephensi]|uniref:uncharacterized protein LOC118503175 n=1 Tax=Anopheles stephensi TaxID=30069 RepID=UPI00165881AF|nr:uncharacterized protein LOC118503175 [Anopheles stephensi]